MLGGREKVGSSVVDISGGGGGGGVFPQKNRRLNFPFGEECSGIDGRDTIHEHFIREIPIAIGALGCALWDGGLVLTRWLYRHGEEVCLNGQANVLELGCGVGLAGIMAAHFSKSVTMTDYIPDALGNCAYNVKLNTLPSNDEVPEELRNLRPGYDFAITNKCKVEYLDWDAVLRASKKAKNQKLTEAEEAKEKEAEEKKAKKQNNNDDEDEPLPEGVTEFTTLKPHSFDVILGAELTYSELSCESLAHVVDMNLTQDGAFHEILSNDRDGVTVFVKEIEKLGFTTERVDVPQEFVGNYGTRKWSKQDQESYSLYTWRRKKETKSAEE